MIRTKSATTRSQTAPKKILILHKTTLKYLSGGSGEDPPPPVRGVTESSGTQTMS